MYYSWLARNFDLACGDDYVTKPRLPIPKETMKWVEIQSAGQARDDMGGVNS